MSDALHSIPPDEIRRLEALGAEAWRASEDVGVGYPPTKARAIEESGVVPYDTIYGRN